MATAENNGSFDLTRLRTIVARDVFIQQQTVLTTPIKALGADNGGPPKAPRSLQDIPDDNNGAYDTEP